MVSNPWMELNAYKGVTPYGGVVVVARDALGNYKGEYRASDTSAAIPKILLTARRRKNTLFLLRLHFRRDERHSLIAFSIQANMSCLTD